MMLREIERGTLEFDRLVELRYRELRVPLGLEWTEEDLRGEGEDRNFGFYDLGELVGVVLAREAGGGVRKLRQIAVVEGRKGTGVGRALMGAVEEVLVEEGVRCFELHARVEVAGFYEKLGYVREGVEFEEIGILHVKMRKRRGWGNDEVPKDPNTQGMTKHE